MNPQSHCKILFMLTLCLLSSCSNKATTEQKQKQQEPEQKIPYASGIVKVLNRVKCIEGKNYCSQEDIDKIWKSCIEDGYVLKLPSRQISSSREIKELTSRYSVYKYEEKIAKETTDANGIVGNVITSIHKNGTAVTVKGYCEGSEYIITR